VKVSPAKLRHQTDAQELADVHAELEKNAEVKELIGHPVQGRWLNTG